MLRSVFAAAIALASLASPALSQSFTYQGDLQFAGAPANGPHDFEFRVYDGPLSPTQIGTTTTLFGAPLDTGRFSATIDPGPGVFTGAERWLEIAARPTGSGAFTILTPRQKITAAPYASRALAEWLVPIGTSVLTNDPTRTRVFFNRDARLNNSEYFGFTAPTPDFTFGGMYINTPGGNALPFYGYSTADGRNLCRTYYSGATRDWVVDNGGDRLRVQVDGNVGIGVPVAAAKLDVNGTVRASSYAYQSPVTKTVSIPGVAFQPLDSSQQVTRESAASGTYIAASVAAGSLAAPLDLPDGCTLESVTLYCVDNTSSASLTLKLFRRPHGQFGTINANTSAPSVTGGVIQTLSITPSLVISNAANSYYIQVDCGDWTGPSTAVFSAIATYSVVAE